MPVSTIIARQKLGNDHLCGPVVSGQSSWLQTQRSGFDSRRYQIILEVVVRERGRFSLVSTIEDFYFLGLQSSTNVYNLSIADVTLSTAKQPLSPTKTMLIFIVLIV
jgi:hypothetical protein